MGLFSRAKILIICNLSSGRYIVFSPNMFTKVIVSVYSENWGMSCIKMLHNSGIFWYGKPFNSEVWRSYRNVIGSSNNIIDFFLVITLLGLVPEQTITKPSNIWYLYREVKSIEWNKTGNFGSDYACKATMGQKSQTIYMGNEIDGPAMKGFENFVHSIFSEKIIMKIHSLDILFALD